MSNTMSVDTFSQAAGESKAAVKNAGYQEDKGTWHSPEKEEVAKKWLEDHSMRTHQFTVRESAPPGLVAFRARILAAVPGKSLNNRVYTRELLKQTAPLYVSNGPNPRPFILDHDIEHSERVTGLITSASYGVQEAMDGRPVEGLWLEALGYMDDKLFAKMVGSKVIPPFVRGVSIGGEGEGEFTGDGVLIRRFQPAELSVTAFPGIAMAHVAEINRIREHYLNQSDKMETSNTFQIREKDISLEEAEKQKLNDSTNPRRIREATLPGPDRGVNDYRPGLPKPTVRSTVVHQVPQPTTSSVSGMEVNPEASTTNSPSSRPMTATGTSSQKGRKGMPTETAPGTAATAGAHGSRDAKAHKIKTPKTGATTTTHPGHGNLSPSGTGMDSEEEETEEESMQDLGNQTSPLPGSSDQPDNHIDLKRSKNPSAGKPSVNPHAKDGEEEESTRIRNADAMDDDTDDEEEEGEEESEEEHGPSPHIPGDPVGKKGPHVADDAYDSPEEEESEETQRINQHDEPVGVTPGAKAGTDSSDDRPEEEEEDGVTLDPIRKTAGQGQHIHANPTKEESQPKVLFSEAEAIQASAFSLPSNSGILQTLATLAGPAKAKEAMAKGSVEELVNTLTRPQHYMSKEEAAKLIEAWNKGKMPKEQKPRKIVMGKAAIGRSADLSVPNARKPPVDESVVRTRSITSTAPTFAGSSISTVPTARLEELLEQEKKKPYSNVSYLNAAKRAWHRAVQDMIQFR